MVRVLMGDNSEKAARYYLGAAVYAYFYLFDQERDKPAEVFSTDFKLACELYNASLAQALTTPQGRSAYCERCA